MKLPKVIGAEIVYSPDDGGWYAQLYERDEAGNINELGQSDIMALGIEAEIWAKQHGADERLITYFT